MIRKFIFAITAALMVSCATEEPVHVAEATLASTSNLEFAAQNPQQVMITVTSDGNWTCNAPEWLSVSPASGTAGQTDVVITVSENMLDGAPDAPRSYTLEFGGNTKASKARVAVRQQGDRYRNLAAVKLDAVYTTPDDDAVALKNVTVTAVTQKGFVATDGVDYMYFTASAKPAQWAKVDVLGIKSTDAAKLAYVKAERVTAVGTAEAVAPSALDITQGLGQVPANRRTMIKARGVYDGSVVKLAGNLSLAVDDAAVDLTALVGHIVEVTGLYAGTAAPVVRITVTAVDDLGVNETIYFKDDFEWFNSWLEPYRDSKGRQPGNAVTEDNPSAYMPQLTTPKLDGVSLMDAMLAKGYKFLGETKANTCGRNYLKMSITDFQGGFTLPAIEAFGNGVKDVTVSFDWTPAKSGAGVYDLTEIVLILQDDTQSVMIPVPARPQPDNARHQWFREEIVLKGITVTRNTRITLRNADSQWGNAKGVFRWYCDNVKIYKAN